MKRFFLIYGIVVFSHFISGIHGQNEEKNFPEFPGSVEESSEKWCVRTDLGVEAARRYLKLLDSLTDEYKEIFSQMKIERWERIDVWIYKKRKDMERTYQIGERVIGMYFPHLKRIISHQGFFGSDGTTAQVLAHEAMHALLHLYLGDLRKVPVWVSEGIAVMTEGMTIKGGDVKLTRVPRDRLLRVRSDIEAKNTISLKDLFSVLSREFDARYYAYAGMFVYFLVKGGLNGTKEALFDYLQTAKENEVKAEDFEKALSTRTGKSLKEVEGLFFKWVMQQKFEYSGKAVGTKYRSDLMEFSVDAPTKDWKINIDSMLAKDEYVVYWRRNPYGRFSVSAVSNLYAYTAAELLNIREDQLKDLGARNVKRWMGNMGKKEAAFVEYDYEDKDVLKDGKPYRVREIWLSTERGVYKLRFQAEEMDFLDMEKEFREAERKFELGENR
ncbi:MAG: DUF1570 domain-containing protein [Planctomycetota bacterium]|nr:DUF1570 domain-containing protein [Planctomycetota bacterium]